MRCTRGHHVYKKTTSSTEPMAPNLSTSALSTVPPSSVALCSAAPKPFGAPTYQSISWHSSARGARTGRDACTHTVNAHVFSCALVAASTCFLLTLRRPPLLPCRAIARDVPAPVRPERCAQARSVHCRGTPHGHRSPQLPRRRPRDHSHLYINYSQIQHAPHRHGQNISHLFVQY